MTEQKRNEAMRDREGKFAISVNGREVEVDQPVLEGRRLLAATGFRPPEDHVLVRLLYPGTRSVGLDEPVEFRRNRREEFRAFRSDRIFRFTIKDRGYQWGAAEISEPELRAIAALDRDATLVLERDGEAITLAADDTLELQDAGTEHLRVIELVTVYLNDDAEKRIPSRSYRTEELIDLLGVEAGYVLDVLDDGQLRPLEPGQMIEVRDGMRFYSHVPAGGSS